MIAKQLVSSKNRGSFDKNNVLKNQHGLLVYKRAARTNV